MSDTHENLVNEWLSVEAAALRLGISSRSIARRIQSGQLESRVDANGRRTVLVCTPAPVVQPPVSHASDPSPASATGSTVTAATATVRDGSVEPSQARELAQQAMTLVIRSHEETVLSARADAIAAKRSSRRAWAAVAILLIGASVTVGIVTRNLTQAGSLVRQAEDRAEQAQSQLQTVAAERDALRDQIVQAKVKEAEAQGQLAAMTIKPTTQPTNVVQRVASALLGE